jgi:hypothetical protein
LPELQRATGDARRDSIASAASFKEVKSSLDRHSQRGLGGKSFHAKQRLHLFHFVSSGLDTARLQRIKLFAQKSPGRAPNGSVELSIWDCGARLKRTKGEYAGVHA